MTVVVREIFSVVYFLLSLLELISHATKDANLIFKASKPVSILHGEQGNTYVILIVFLNLFQQTMLTSRFPLNSLLLID